ncbi:Lactate dehydrogenase/glycoside hydrolase, family 4, C-terminal [Artemisia annua]|uniref:Lactate dehydrogenase/glycoside hydrolase, family 4, C-terminal n=1 Tax=Artemisia annua TaxID=35608 RepID=A0A2U1PAE4_ARTAN|nr:Lactate dehydrogenase/glycoside hydrolase, family 4, C-terminal [Artemisia annua]
MMRGLRKKGIQNSSTSHTQQDGWVWVKPACSFTKEETEYLTKRIQDGGTEAIARAASTKLSMAYAAVKFADCYFQARRLHEQGTYNELWRGVCGTMARGGEHKEDPRRSGESQETEHVIQESHTFAAAHEIKLDKV